MKVFARNTAPCVCVDFVLEKVSIVQKQCQLEKCSFCGSQHSCLNYQLYWGCWTSIFYHFRKQFMFLISKCQMIVPQIASQSRNGERCCMCLGYSCQVFFLKALLEQTPFFQLGQGSGGGFQGTVDCLCLLSLITVYTVGYGACCQAVRQPAEDFGYYKLDQKRRVGNMSEDTGVFESHSACYAKS